MNVPEQRFFIGAVEQAIPGGADPVSPAISVSRNGSLAKWRDKIHFLDIRVNDPGLKSYGAPFRELLAKARSVGVEVVLTLPEAVPTVYEIPTPPPSPPKPGIREISSRVRNIQHRAVFFRPCYLGVPRTVPNPDSFHSLTIEESLEIVELGAANGVAHIVIPVSEPGVFLDPAAGEEFKAKFQAIAKVCSTRGIKCHLRNGGLTRTFFEKLSKETGCGLAFNVGTAHIERNNILDWYSSLRDRISILFLHQVLPGLDKLQARKDGIERASREFFSRWSEYSAALARNDTHDLPLYQQKVYEAYRSYGDSLRNPSINLGVFQNGDINFVPLLRALKSDLEAGKEKFLVIEAVPSLKNAEFLAKFLLSDGLSTPF